MAETLADPDTRPQAATGLPARPLPVGAFPLPAGYLLVPPGPDTEDARLALLDGRLPERWPDPMRAHELALSGDSEGALAALTGDDLVSRYNRFVLDPDHADPAQLRVELGELGVLVDVVLFTAGLSDLAPPVGEADAELGALVLCAQASEALAADDPALATRLLDDAADLTTGVAPALTGVLLNAAAAAARQEGAPGADVVTRLEGALRALDGAEDLRLGRAETHLALGLALHELAADRLDMLNRAIPHYHAALRLVLSSEAPLVWASAHANLAAAYLTIPMTEASDQLRLGVAVQSLRSALKVYTREEHPAEWASTQLNLANSLVYTPSTHQGDNLVEAVELYEAVLELRPRDTDPLGRARVLANQGNVLAHLGMFDVAKAKLYDARFIFEEFSDGESVRAVRGVLDEVARQLALQKNQD